MVASPGEPQVGVGRASFRPPNHEVIKRLSEPQGIKRALDRRIRGNQDQMTTRGRKGFGPRGFSVVNEQVYRQRDAVEDHGPPEELEPVHNHLDVVIVSLHVLPEPRLAPLSRQVKAHFQTIQCVSILMTIRPKDFVKLRNAGWVGRDARQGTG